MQLGRLTRIAPPGFEQPPGEVVLQRGPAQAAQVLNGEVRALTNQSLD